MAPKMGKWRPGGKLVPLYEAKRDRADDPHKIAYKLTAEAASILVAAEKMRKSPVKVLNGYVARHLVEKGCLKRLPGRDSSYQITLRGEAVVECLRQRQSMAYLFTDRKPPEL